MQPWHAGAFIALTGAGLAIAHFAWPVGGDIVAVLASMGLLAMPAGWRRACKSRSRAWGAFAGAGAPWAFSYVVTGYYQLTHRQLAPVPSLADVGNLGLQAGDRLDVELVGRDSMLVRVHHDHKEEKEESGAAEQIGPAESSLRSGG